MDRLTYDCEVGGVHCWQIHGADNRICEEVCAEYSSGCKDNGGCPIAKAFDRLAEYEDTGLTPEEMKLFDQEKIEHLACLIKAEAEGRLIVLPCKVGDTVWFIDRTFDWNTGKWTDYVNDGYVKAIKFSARPTKITVEYPDPYSKNDAFKGADYNVRNIGKTLFLTHEEAEKALEEK